MSNLDSANYATISRAGNPVTFETRRRSDSAADHGAAGHRHRAPIARHDIAARPAAQKQLASAYVVSLLRRGVLRCGVKVAQPPLQRRALVERAAAAQREACRGDANAGGGEPCRGLRALREERLVL